MASTAFNPVELLKKAFPKGFLVLEKSNGVEAVIASVQHQIPGVTKGDILALRGAITQAFANEPCFFPGMTRSTPSQFHVETLSVAVYNFGLVTLGRRLNIGVTTRHDGQDAFIFEVADTDFGPESATEVTTVWVFSCTSTDEVITGFRAVNVPANLEQGCIYAIHAVSAEEN